MAFRVALAQTALDSLAEITDTRTRSAIMGRIETLRVAPIQVGKPPGDELSGFLTTRAARQRYRIIYKVNQDQEHVIVYLVGIRKEGSPEDVYRIAVRLQARGFI